jgi:hypothetical protein
MTNHFNKIFNLKNLKILEEEKPRVYDKIQDSQIKKITFNSKILEKNNNNNNDYEFKNIHSERLKNIYPINYQSNKNKNLKFQNNNNSLNENYNNSNKFHKKKLIRYSSAIFNINNLNIKNIEFDDKKNIMKLVFNRLGIGNIYLDKIYSNKIDFNDLLLLTKDDLKEMEIPIGPRNRILTFIKDYSLYKENYKKDNIYLINQFFNLNNMTFNCQNSSMLNDDNLYKINSPTINHKTKYNNNFDTNVNNNNILVKQEIKNYLNNSPHNLTINVNRTLGSKKLNNYNKKSYIPLLTENSKFESKNDTYIIQNNNDNSQNYLKKRKKIINSNLNNDFNLKTFKNFNKNKYKPNSRLKYISGSNNSRNSKQFINDNFHNYNSYNKKRNITKERKGKIKKNGKSVNSFTDEGLSLLYKMKENLNSKLKKYTKSIGEKKHLLKLLEDKNN